MSIARMIKNIDRLAALDARGKLTAKNIVATCFADLHITGRYEFAKLHNAFLEIGDVLGYAHGSSLQIQKILGDTGCTLAEAQAAYNEGVDIPTLPYIASHQMDLDGFGTIASARAQLALDFMRPMGYHEIKPQIRPLLDENHDGFRVAFPGGERIAIGKDQAGVEKAEIVAQKIEDMCGRVHPRQAASVMALLSQSGLSTLRGGLKRHNILSTEHSAVEFTLSKDEETGDITIRYASPKELKFAFEWTSTVKPDGSVTTTPMRFTDENTVTAEVATASANIKARFAHVLPEEAGIQGPAIDKLLESAKTDRDLLAMLQKGGAELSACYALGLSLVCLRLEDDALRAIQAGLNSVNSAKVSSACELLRVGEFPDGNTQPQNVRTVISNIADSMGSHLTSMRQSIDGAIINVLGHDFDGDIPGEEQISPAEFASIYKVIEKHVLETHRNEIAQQ